MSNRLLKGGALTPSAIAHLARSWRPGLTATARDYLYEDRLVRRTRWPSRIAAELHGYHDRYIPHCAQNSEGLQVGCTCAREGLCAHVAALLLDFEQHPDHYVPLPSYDVFRALRHDASWDWARGSEFPWYKIPEDLPFWRFPPIPEALNKWNRAFSSPIHNDTIIFAMLKDCHPAWCESDNWQQLFQSWLAHTAKQTEDPAVWIDLIACNPQLPFDPLTMTGPALDRRVQDIVLHYLWALPGGQESPPVLRLLALFTRTTDFLDRPIVDWLWERFRWADPNFLNQADAYYQAGHLDQAVRLLEDRLPAHPSARHAARERLISWIGDPKERLAHQIADVLETGSEDNLNQLRQYLPDPEWQRIREAFKTRASISGEE